MARDERARSRSRRPDPYAAAGSSSRTALGIAFLVLTAALLGTVGWFYFWSRSTLVELRPDDLCPRDGRGPPAVYVVLIDQTDPLGLMTQQSVSNAVLGLLRSELESAAAAGRRHARMEVWTFSNSGIHATLVGDVRVATEKVLAICNPGAPGEWDHLYRNVATVRRQHARFYDELSQTIARSLSFPEAQQSPVIEALYATGVQVFSKPGLQGAGKRLIVVSDLLQNTRNLSMFGAIPKYDDWVRTAHAQRALPNLRGVEPTVFVLPGARPELQRDDFVAFWMALLKSAGAANIRLERIR